MLKKNSVGALVLQAVFIFAAVLVVTLVVSAATSQKKEKPTDGLPKGNSLPPFVPREKRQIRKPNFPPNDLTPFKQEGNSAPEKTTRHALGSSAPADRPTTTTADPVTLGSSSTGAVIAEDAVTFDYDFISADNNFAPETGAGSENSDVSETGDGG